MLEKLKENQEILIDLKNFSNQLQEFDWCIYWLCPYLRYGFKKLVLKNDSAFVKNSKLISVYIMDGYKTIVDILKSIMETGFFYTYFCHLYNKIDFT